MSKPPFVSNRRARAWRRALALLVLVLALPILLMVPGHASDQPPNILFVIMDDVGIDQMAAFGYGGISKPPFIEPPNMPTIEQLADAGVRFSNTWSMPACTTSRAVMFTGRFPLRTNVYGALGENDLANSHVSPYEMTTPRLLKERGYQSALFGKFHLALQDNSPFSYSMVRSLGWDYYYGWLDKTGDPSSIDTTAGINPTEGGVVPPGGWSCGFVPDAKHGGADHGACYAVDGTCQEMTIADGIPPGRACRDAGGIFDPIRTCQNPRPKYIDFTKLSGHYVSPLYINHEDGGVEEVLTTDIRARTYRGTGVVDAAVDWIKRQPANRPWMATVSFASAHTPVMQPPAALLPADEAAATSGLDCTNTLANTGYQRILTDQMIEAMDKEIGRLFVQTGLASYGSDGSLIYNPENTNTMIVIVGDNGSFASAVKEPFDGGRSKGTAYQTGVWVPLIVAGPLVEQPNRAVRHMVNIADLYQLFGEIAGIDVAASVPHVLDSMAMLPYLVEPERKSVREWNFTQVGPNLQVNRTLNAPCTIGASCTQIPVSKEVCQDNGGTWWGKDSDVDGIPEEGLTYCCQVNQFLRNNADPQNPPRYYTIQPLTSVATRNANYKVVRNSLQDYDIVNNVCDDVTTDEFYQINEDVPKPLLDERGKDLNAKGSLTSEQQKNYRTLSKQLDAILTSHKECPGDGNIDGVVDDRDVEEWGFYQGKSSWYDFNLDGLTDSLDLQTIMNNLGKRCKK
jgi:sulfatase-like protein